MAARKEARITIELLYRKVISLEAKTSLLSQGQGKLLEENKIIMDQVFIYVIILMFLSVINIFIHLFLMLGKTP